MKKHFRRLASNFNYDLRFFMYNLLQTSYAFFWLNWNHFPESSVIVKCGPDKANMRKIWSEIFNAVWYDLNYKPKSFVLDYSISLTKSAFWWSMNHIGEKNTVYPVILAMIISCIIFYRNFFKIAKNDWRKLRMLHIFPMFENFVTRKKTRIYGICPEQGFLT